MMRSYWLGAISIVSCLLLITGCGTNNSQTSSHGGTTLPPTVSDGGTALPYTVSWRGINYKVTNSRPKTIGSEIGESKHYQLFSIPNSKDIALHYLNQIYYVCTPLKGN